MGLDTKYRPVRYADVLGQTQTIDICRRYVRQGAGFHQSYMFYGPFGTGKTTLGRILARALLCRNPQEGEACEACPSCLSFGEGSSETFVEFDAATNSGKEDIRRLLDDVNYNTFSGSRRIYLVDESHELSRQAMDALLKPLEQTWPKSLEKQLVCIFCTTEPDKMRPAILSRCAPSFRITLNTPTEIAARMASICQMEAIPFEMEALLTIAEVKECHIRDCLKALEALQVLGGATSAMTKGYLHLGIHEIVLDLVAAIGGDESKIVEGLHALEELVSPASAYQRLAEVCLLAYKLHAFGNTPIPSYLPRDRMLALGKTKAVLLDAARTFSERPHRSSYVMLGCDLLAAGRRKREVVVEEGPPAPESVVEVPREDPAPEPHVTASGVGWNPVAVNRPAQVVVEELKPSDPPAMGLREFLQVFMEYHRRGNATESKISDPRQPGQPDLGGVGVDARGV